jgi:biopolymer transport protein ExbD
MKINLDTPAEEARIELVPLIDVIFCILTFFLLAALQLTRQQAINVDLPKAKTGQTQMREMLIVSIDDFGQTYIDQLPVNYQQLDRVLKSFQSKNPAGLMVLYAPQNARYAKVVEVLDKLREVGGDRVALATLPSSLPPRCRIPRFPILAFLRHLRSAIPVNLCRLLWLRGSSSSIPISFNLLSRLLGSSSSIPISFNPLSPLLGSLATLG